jgi:DNA-binding MarR family transcriptional regulator
MASQASHQNDVFAAVNALRRIVQAVRAASVGAEQQTGLSGAQLFVLQQLAEAPAESLNELAARTLTHQSSVSVVVSRLVRRGLVTRARAERDRRRRVIELTATGRAVMRTAPETFQVQLINVLESMQPRERRTVGRALELLVQRLGLEREPAGMLMEPETRGERRPRG